MEFETPVCGQDRIGSKTLAKPIVTASGEIRQLRAKKKAANRLKGEIGGDNSRVRVDAGNSQARA
jgi:hypothetical protein